MAVSEVGTPAATVYTTTNGTNTPTLAWSGSQPRTAGDLLVLTVTAAATTSVTAPSTPSGWTAGPAGGNTGTTPHAYTAIFWKIATGSDSVPSISVTTSGTTRCGFTLLEFTGVNQASPVDTSGTFGSGSSSATIASITVTTSGNVTLPDEYAIACFAREQATAATMPAWTPGSGWSNLSNDGSTSSRDHNAVDTYSNPPSGSALSDAATMTSAATAYSAASIMVIATAVGNVGPALTGLNQAVGTRVVLVRTGLPMTSLIPPAPAAPPAPAPLYPQTRPAGRLRGLPPRGIVRGVAGAALVVGVLGPPARPLHSPVTAGIPNPAAGQQTRLPSAGRVYSHAGTRQNTGPPAPALHRPVSAPARPLPPRGMSRSQPGSRENTGPAVLPSRRPARAQLAFPVRRGRSQATPVQPPAPPVTPPPLTPLRAPVRARLPQPLRGCTLTMVGLPGQALPVPAPLTPLRSPVRAAGLPPALHGRAATMAALPVPAAPAAGAPLPPKTTPWRAVIPAAARGGTARGSAGAYQGTGLPQAPLSQPAGVQVVIVREGSVQTSGPYAPSAAPPVTPAPLYPLTQPARARLLKPPPGRAATMAPLVVTPVTPASGPPLTPLRAPVRAAWPARVRGGRGYGSRGIRAQTGPSPRPLTSPVTVSHALPPAGHIQRASPPQQAPAPPQLAPAYPLRSPARAVIPPRPRAGYARSLRGVPESTGPVLRPAAGPVTSRQPLPPRGQIWHSIPPPPVFIPPASGPPLTPLRTPVRAPVPARPRGGTVHGLRGVYESTGSPARPLTSPVRPPVLPTFSKGRAQHLAGVYDSTGGPVPPLRQPVRARQPLPPAGRQLVTPAYVPPVVPPGRIPDTCTLVVAAETSYQAVPGAGDQIAVTTVTYQIGEDCPQPAVITVDGQVTAGDVPGQVQVFTYQAQRQITVPGNS